MSKLNFKVSQDFKTCTNDANHQGQPIKAHRPNLAHHLFCTAYRLKNGFYIFFPFLNGWKNEKKNIFHDTQKLYEIQIPVSINTMVLELSHTYLFLYCL